jgi:hypothetical protein
MPTASMPASRAAGPRANATQPSAITSNAACTSIRQRRSMRSPSGTSTTSASAQPSCVAVTTPPTAAWEIENVAASASSNGCA